MAWLKVDDRVRTHPKIVEAGPLAAWVWFCGICYCREHLTDGFIADKMLATLVPGLTSFKKAAAALVSAGLWHRAERGYQVHDFLDWNPSRVDVELQRAADRARKGAGSHQDSSRIPSGTPTDSSHTRDAHAQAPARAKALGSSSLEGGSGETNASPRSASILSPADYDKLARHNAYVGARLRVPHKLHSDFIAQLGGQEPDTALRAWYASVDAEIEASGEVIHPNVWKWLTARFETWVGDAAEAVEWAKIEAWAKEGA